MKRIEVKIDAIAFVSDDFDTLSYKDKLKYIEFNCKYCLLKIKGMAVKKKDGKLF